MVWGHPLFSTYPSLAGWWEYRNRKPLDRNHRRNPWFPIGSPIGRSVSQSIDPWISIKKRLICEPIPIIHHFWDQESLSDWWFETFFLCFHYIGNVIIPTDELTPSFFRGLGGSTTNQQSMVFPNKRPSFAPPEVRTNMWWVPWAEVLTPASLPRLGLDSTRAMV